MVVSEKKPKPKAKEVKQEAKKEEVTPPTTPPPKEAKEEVKKEAKKTKPTTKEAKPETKPPTKRKPRIETTTWEKFEKFEPETQPKKKSWIKEAIERAKKEPVEIKYLTKGQILAILVQVYRYNLHNYPKLDVKYDMKKGIALIAPIKTKTEV
jgi:flagellar biosynthesis GTPase FlhF